jgi:hypothetical protein
MNKGKEEVKIKQGQGTAILSQEKEEQRKGTYQSANRCLQGRVPSAQSRLFQFCDFTKAITLWVNLCAYIYSISRSDRSGTEGGRGGGRRQKEENGTRKTRG